MTTGVIGLGNISGHLATNLVADGHVVMVHDLDAQRAASITGAAERQGAGELPWAEES